VLPDVILNNLLPINLRLNSVWWDGLANRVLLFKQNKSSGGGQATRYTGEMLPSSCYGSMTCNS